MQKKHITEIIWNFPAKNSKILRLIDKIKSGEELQIRAYEKGITKSFNQQLFKSIKRAKELIETNKFYGDNIKKNQIPEYYKQKYGATNLFRVELVGYWRLIYTLESGNNIEILAIIVKDF